MSRTGPPRARVAVALAVALLIFEAGFADPASLRAGEPTPTPTPTPTPDGKPSVGPTTPGPTWPAAATALPGPVGPVGPGGPTLAGVGIVLPRDGTIVVQTFRSLAALAIDDLGLAQPVVQPLVADAAHVATTVTIGPYTAGTALVFSLYSSFTGETYLSTGNHAQVWADAADRWSVAWEDWTDFNFSDVTMRVCYEGPVRGCPLPPERTLGNGGFGNGSNPQVLQAEPVNTATGNYVTTATDVRLPGRGLDLALVRTYNSLATAGGPLGPGWTHSLAARIVANPDGSATFVAEDGAMTTYAGDGSGGFLRPPGAYGILSRAGGGFELFRRDQVRLSFDAGGTLLALTDRNGNRISLAYTGSDLTTITDTVGRTLTLGYTAGQLTSILDPLNRNTLFSYHPDGHLATVTDVFGGVTSYGYDAAGRLATITDQNGHVLVTNTYGPDGRVAEQLDALGHRTTFAWDPLTETSTMTDARGGQWVDDYDGGVLMSRRDPLGNMTSHAFAADLGLSAVVDARGLITETNVDSFGNLYRLKVASPFNYTESWTFNSRNDPLSHTDRRGNTTTYGYDAAGNLRTVTGPPPMSPVTTFGYDPAGTGLLVSVTDPRGMTTTFGYDAQANRNRITTPLGFITTMTYDAVGRMLTQVEARGNVGGANPADYTTTWTYDDPARRVTVTDPLGDATATVSDPVGNTISVTDANNHTTSFGYDEANHLRTVTDPATKVTTYEYDDSGNLVRRIDANNHVTVYAYDLANRLTGMTDPLNRVWTYGYDANGNRTTIIDANGNATPTPGDGTTTMTYDALNRLASIDYSDTSPDVTFGYDANGNLTTMTEGSASETRTFDARNLLTQQVRGVNTFGYTYDAAGNLSTRTYPSPDGTVVTYAYDSDGRLAAVTAAGAFTIYGYDAAAHLTTVTLPSASGYVETRTYDRAGRLTEVRHAKGGTALASFTYVLDPAGNISQTTSLADRRTYAYDPDDRLTDETCILLAGGNCAEPFYRYTYDFVGNRLTEQRGGGTTSYIYDAADQLTSRSGLGGSVSYSYDANGNTTAAGSRTFVYDLANRTRTTTSGSTTTTYSYTGDGRRLEASTGSAASAKTRFVWDVNSGLPLLALERDGNNAVLRRYLYGAGLVSMTVGNSTYYYHADRLGSVVNLTSGNGTKQWTWDYGPFGTLRSETKHKNNAPANFLKYAGGYLDPTALYHLRARQYDPIIGRFTTIDPAPGPVTDPYLAAYVYARNNPIRLTDPSGRCIPQAAAGAVAGAPLGPVGAAGGGTVGFLLCVAALAVGAVVVKEVIVDPLLESRQDPTDVTQEVPFEEPRMGPPPNPNLGSEHPENPFLGCMKNPLTKTACLTLVVALVNEAVQRAGESPGEGIPRPGK